MNVSKIEALFQKLMALTDQPFLVAIVVIGVPLVLLSSASRKYRWWLMLVWAFFLPLTPFTDWRGNWTPPPFPFNKLVEHGRQIAFFLMLAMIPASIQSKRFNTSVKTSQALMALLLVNCIYCLRYIPTVHSSLALLRLVTTCIVFFVLAYALPKRIGDRTDVFRYLSASAGAALLVVVLSILCYLISPNSVVKAGRMGGLTSNPNFLGTLCGLSFPAFLGLALYPNRSFRHKAFWVLAAGLLLITMAWTGSRTAFGMVCIAIIVMFRKRVGTLFIVGVPLALIVVALSVFLAESQSAASRLTSLGDTRTAVWGNFYELWQKDPLFGNTDIGMRTVENSFLTVVANAGVPGGLAMILFTILAIRVCMQLYHLNTNDPELVMLREISLAGILVALGGSCFVGFLVSNLSTDAYWIFLYFILAEVTKDFVLRSSPVYAYQVLSPYSSPFLVPRQS